MGLLTPDDHELHLVRSNSKESLQLWGIPAKLHLATLEESDIYNDKTITYQDPEDIHVLLEDSNLVRVLKNNGWYTDNSDELPLVAYLPYDTTPVRESILEVSNRVPDLRYKKYLISIVLFDHLASHWICKLVPYRNQRDYDESTEEVDTSVNDPDDLEDLTFIPGIQI